LTSNFTSGILYPCLSLKIGLKFNVFVSSQPVKAPDADIQVNDKLLSTFLSA
jgi:hypothetical protein